MMSPIAVEVAQWVAQYYPASLFSIVMGSVVVWQLQPGALKSVLAITLSLLLGALLIITFCLGYYSIHLLFYSTALLALSGDFLFLFYAYLCCRRKTDMASRVRQFMSLCVLGGLCVFGTWRFTADYMAPHRIVTGVVGEVVYHRGRHVPDHYGIYIGNKSYTVTEDLLSALHPGATIRAEIGAGTGVILSFVPLNTQTPAP